MATKVKGEVIKESSIPLSALANSLQEEINVKYGLSGYVGELSSSNTIIESPSSMLYLYVNGEIYNNMTNGDIIMSNGPRVVFKFTSYGYKTTIERKEGADEICYYGKVLVFNKNNPIPKEIPDWNAGKYEKGFIKNKPFGINYDVGIKLSELKVLDFYTGEDDETIIELDYGYGDYILFTDYYGETHIQDIWYNEASIDLPNGYTIYVVIDERFNEEWGYDAPYIRCTAYSGLTQEKFLECLSYIKNHDVEEDFITRVPDIFLDKYNVLKANVSVGEYYAKMFRNTLGLEPIWTYIKYMFNKININDTSRLPNDILTILNDVDDKEKVFIFYNILCLSYDDVSYKFPTSVDTDGYVYFGDEGFIIQNNGYIDPII